LTHLGHFFENSRKSACDGIIGTVKHLVAG